MEYLKGFIEQKLTPNERIELIKLLMDVDLIYDEIQSYVLDNLEEDDAT